jgi:pimeloyl-ACP methyl ester carboxylesterase
VTLVADVTGAGLAVVLLHGQPGSAADWLPVSRLLAASFTVIVPDRLGYGRTGGPAGGFHDNAAAVLELLDELQVDRATIVGHSWSGGVAIALAQEAPVRVAGAVLIASVGPGEPLGRVDRLLAIPPIGTAAAAISLNLAARALSIPPIRRVLDRYLRGTSDEGLLAVAEGWRRGEAWRSFVVEQRALFDELGGLAPGLAGIGVPVTVMIGGSDRIVPASTGLRLAAAIPGARLIRLEGAGHLLAHERPEAVAAAIAQAATRSRS